jgi:hypothetical protein
MGPPLGKGRTYHPRPHPEKIIEQLDPERIIDLPHQRKSEEEECSG